MSTRKPTRQGHRPILCDWEIEWAKQVLETISKPAMLNARNIESVEAYLRGIRITALARKYRCTKQNLYGIIRKKLQHLELDSYRRQQNQGRFLFPHFS